MLPALNDPQVKSWFGAAGDEHKPPAGAFPQSALWTMTWRGLINRKGILIGHGQVWALEPEDGYFLV